jgi:hypothetical protein
MYSSELFYLVDADERRWIIRHAITDQTAGTILRTSQGIVLRNEDSRFLGTFPNADMALRNLYALV